jgi:hypothetical protein
MDTLISPIWETVFTVVSILIAIQCCDQCRVAKARVENY